MSEERAEEGRGGPKGPTDPTGAQGREGHHGTARESGRTQSGRTGRGEHGRVPSRRLAPGQTRILVDLSSISENEAVRYELGAELAERYVSPISSPNGAALNGDATDKGRWQGGQGGQGGQGAENLAEAVRSRTAPLPPLTPASTSTPSERHQRHRQPQDLLRFEHRFTELANSGQGAAVSAAWAMLAERARDERIQDAVARSAGDAARSGPGDGELGEGLPRLPG